MTDATSPDHKFAGSIPAMYDTHLVPMLFAPYAADMVSRVRARSASAILEIAAGTGVVTRALALATSGANAPASSPQASAFPSAAPDSEERPGRLLGTAGALRAALGMLAPRFLVTYGDSYLTFDYAAPLRLLERHGDCDGVMAIYRNAGRFEPSNVETDGEWVIRYRKDATGPELDHIDYGASALRREVIEALPPGVALGLDQVQEELAARRRLRALVVHERFFEIGSPAGWAELEHHLRKTR